MKKTVLKNKMIITYPDYKRIENIFSDTFKDTKDSINPLNFFLPSKGYSDLEKKSLLKSFFAGRHVNIPSFQSETTHLPYQERFEEFTKKDEVSNISLWILSALKSVASSPLRVGKELEINQPENPRDGRLDVVAIRNTHVMFFEAKTDLKSLLDEGRFVYQVKGYAEEGIKCIQTYFDSGKVSVYLVVGGEETDMYPPEHIDCTSGAVGNMAKIFYDKLRSNSIKFISANALWAVVAYQYVTEKDIDLFDIIDTVFTNPKTIGLLTAGSVIDTTQGLAIEEIELD